MVSCFLKHSRALGTGGSVIGVAGADKARVAGFQHGIGGVTLVGSGMRRANRLAISRACPGAVTRRLTSPKKQVVISLPARSLATGGREPGGAWGASQPPSTPVPPTRGPYRRDGRSQHGRSQHGRGGPTLESGLAKLDQGSACKARDGRERLGETRRERGWLVSRPGFWKPCLAARTGGPMQGTSARRQTRAQRLFLQIFTYRKVPTSSRPEPCALAAMSLSGR